MMLVCRDIPQAAQVSTKHAGFIVNVDHGTATDYLNVIHHVQATVKENSVSAWKLRSVLSAEKLNKGLWIQLGLSLTILVFILV